VTPLSPAQAPSTERPERTHWRWLLGFFVIETVIMEPLIWFVLRKHLPPGDATSAAIGAQFDTAILVMLAGPIFVGVVGYFGYAMFTWRHRKGDPLVDGPPIRGNMKVQVTWLLVTSAIVMGAFVFGTYELVIPAGAGGGEGPSPIWTPASNTVLPIQVIAQQWLFTYRYPTYGGFETTQLIIPNNTQIAFHVTSLDVIHDFWAYQLGVKADANPGVDDVAFTKTVQDGRFVVRCDELCGIWHGAMYNYGSTVPRATFQAWATSTEKKLDSATKLLPKFAWSYTPSANGAGGSSYPSQDQIPSQYLYSNGVSGAEGNLPAPATTSHKGS
jgi:cytochrome c oxidase subunit 2